MQLRTSLFSSCASIGLLLEPSVRNQQFFPAYPRLYTWFGYPPLMTPRKSKSKTTPLRKGQTVVRDGMIAVYHVERVSADGKTADIRDFHNRDGTGIVRDVPVGKLMVFPETRFSRGSELQMNGQKRYLQFANIETDKHIAAWCSVCGLPFTAEPKRGDRTDDLILKVRAEFEAHTCTQQPRGASK